MEFTNEPLSIEQLPQFEHVPLHPLHATYVKVVALQALGFDLALMLVACFVYAKADDFSSIEALVFWSGSLVCIGLIAVMMYFSYRKKAYAFREHDVLFQYGIIATNTKIIPYNRVQHVALHEGFLSRNFGLAQVEIYTAGVHGGDIKIPGILKEDAERIKQLLMGKIQKEL